MKGLWVEHLNWERYTFSCENKIYNKKILKNSRNIQMWDIQNI